MFNSTTVYNHYSNTLPYVETYDTSYTSSNATYMIPDNYYTFITIKEESNNKQFIKELYANNKYFGKEESNAEKNIIKKLSVPLKNNYMDYYE